MSQIPRSHLVLWALMGAAIWTGVVMLAAYIQQNSQEREAGNSPPPVQGGSPIEPVSPSSPIPSALVDPALTTPTRAQLGEPAPPADSPSSFPSIAEGQVSLLTLEGELGKWVKDYVQKNPNGPWIKIPKNARSEDLLNYAQQMRVIVSDWETSNDSLKQLYGGSSLDLLAFSNDPRVRQNDRDRQQKLKNALNSIWPGAMP